jgi:hypothetical protein
MAVEGAEREALHSLGRAIEASRDARVEPARVAELSERLRRSLADRAAEPGLHAAGHVSRSLSKRSGLTIGAALLGALSVLVALWLVARGTESAQPAHARQASADEAPPPAASTSGASETAEGEVERGRVAAAPGAAREPARASTGTSLARPDKHPLDSVRKSASQLAASVGQASKSASGAASRGHARAQRPAQTATPARESPSAGELALLARSQAALERDPRAALALAEEHRQHYPRGVFTEEREMLAIEALQKLRRKPDAVARARAFVALYPSSPHARRVRALLDSAVGGGATHE